MKGTCYEYVWSDVRELNRYVSDGGVLWSDVRGLNRYISDGGVLWSYVRGLNRYISDGGVLWSHVRELNRYVSDGGVLWSDVRGLNRYVSDGGVRVAHRYIFVTCVFGVLVLFLFLMSDVACVSELPIFSNVFLIHFLWCLVLIWDFF